jgi:mercuric ion transport protein
VKKGAISMQGKSATILGSVGAGILSMVCCVGPVVLSALGLGGGALLAQLTPLQPYWIGLSVVMLGIGFYLTYRSRKVPCEDGTCTIEHASLWNKVAIWSATVGVAVMIALPYALGIVASQDTAMSAMQKATAPVVQPASASLTTPVPATPVTLHQLTLAVKGMTCEACPLTVKNFIGSVSGVTGVKVTLEPPQAVVIYNAAATSPDQIVKSLKEPYVATIVADALIKQ